MENVYGLTLWTRPECYGGFNPEGDFFIYAKNRDSSILEESNFDTILEYLKNEIKARGLEDQEPHYGEEKPFESCECHWVYTFTARHWACGWVEYMLVRQDAPKEIQSIISDIMSALADYPVFSDEEYSQRQDEAVYRYWEELSIKDRIEYLSENSESIFAARREDEIPEQTYMRLSESIY